MKSLLVEKIRELPGYPISLESFLAEAAVKEMWDVEYRNAALELVRFNVMTNHYREGIEGYFRSVGSLLDKKLSGEQCPIARFRDPQRLKRIIRKAFEELQDTFEEL
jgi:hypothetical protein